MDERGNILTYYRDPNTYVAMLCEYSTSGTLTTTDLTNNVPNNTGLAYDYWAINMLNWHEKYSYDYTDVFQCADVNGAYLTVDNPNNVFYRFSQNTSAVSYNDEISHFTINTNDNYIWETLYFTDAENVLPPMWRVPLNYGNDKYLTLGYDTSAYRVFYYIDINAIDPDEISYNYDIENINNSYDTYWCGGGTVTSASIPSQIRLSDTLTFDLTDLSVDSYGADTLNLLPDPLAVSRIDIVQPTQIHAYGDTVLSQQKRTDAFYGKLWKNGNVYTVPNNIAMDCSRCFSLANITAGSWRV